MSHAPPSPAAPEPSGSPAAPATSAVGSPAPVPGIGVMLCAGVAAVLLSWVLINQFGKTFGIPASVLTGVSNAPTAEQQARFAKYDFIAQTRNSALRIGIFGAALAALLGLAAAFGRRRLTDALAGAFTAVVVGGLVGAVGGAAAGFVQALLPTEEAVQNWADESYRNLAPIVFAMLVHAAAFAIAGIGVGLAVSLVMGRRDLMRPMIVNGLGAGLIGALLYTPLSTALLPNADESAYPRGSMERLLWIALPGLLIAYATAHAAKPPRRAT